MTGGTIGLAKKDRLSRCCASLKSFPGSASWRTHAANIRKQVPQLFCAQLSECRHLRTWQAQMNILRDLDIRAPVPENTACERGRATASRSVSAVAALAIFVIDSFAGRDRGIV